MFWALAQGRVDARGYEFEHVLQDIQTLNEWALQGRLEVSALSLHAYPFVQERYVLLPHGASMGFGYGPIVVSREPVDLKEVEIAIPGKMTTAFLTLRLHLGADFRYRDVPFDQILDEVSSGRADAGLLIHEGQLTYGAIGLQKVVDLGERAPVSPDRSPDGGEHDRPAHAPTKSTWTGAVNAPAASPRLSSSVTASRPSSP